MHFRVLYCNIKSNPKMSAAKVLHDLLAISKRSGNVFLSEIAPSYYKNAVLSVFKSHKYKIEHLHTENPHIINGDVFTVDHAAVYWVKKSALAGVSPRRCTTVSLCHTNDDHKTPVAFMFDHRVSGVLSKKFPYKFRLNSSLRHQDLNQRLVKQFVEAGFLVIGGEDSNLHRVPEYHPDQVWVHDAGIDKMWYIPSDKWTLEVLNCEEITDLHTFLDTDHPALWMSVKIHAKALFPVGTP
jgi:hypothetical protein